MTLHISKNRIGSLISFIKPNLNLSKTVIILIGSMCLLNAAPYFENTSLLNTTTMTSHYGHLKLKISTSTLSYYTEFYFNSNASQGLDPGYDASIFGGNPPAFSVYSHLVENNTGLAFAVQALSDTDMNDVTVPLGINASQGQQVSFSIDQSDIPDSIKIYLEDRVNNTVTLINTEDYNFTADTNLVGTGRFFISFEADALSTNDQNLEKLNVYTDTLNNTIVVKGNLDSDTEFRLYDINGRLVNYKVLEMLNTKKTIDTTSLSKGVYIVKLINKNAEERTQKIIIQ